MPARLRLDLTTEQQRELARLRDTAPKPHVRERAAALLKVHAGWSARAVACHGLLRSRRRETVARWVHDYQTDGVASFAIRPGRGRKPAFSPAGPRRRRPAGA
jgi:transposase